MQSSFNYQNLTSNLTLIPAFDCSYEFVNANLAEYNRIISQLALANYNLNFELQQVRESLQSVTEQLQVTKKVSSQILKRRDRALGGERLNVRKIFKKDKFCPVQGCNKRYSSKIAVNAHLRKCHTKKNAAPLN